jgi:hypothetical protein
MTPLQDYFRDHFLDDLWDPFKDVGLDPSTALEEFESTTIASQLVVLKNFIEKGLPKNRKSESVNFTDGKIQELFQVVLMRCIQHRVDLSLKCHRSMNLLMEPFVLSSRRRAAEGDQTKTVLTQWKKDPSILLQGESEQKWLKVIQGLVLKANEPEIRIILTTEGFK